MASTENDLKTLAAKRVRAKREFAEHLVVYAIINASLMVIWALTGAEYPWFLWPLVGWGAALAIHGVTLLISLSMTDLAGTDREARAVDRETRRLQGRTTGS
jgi:hypothetical protein